MINNNLYIETGEVLSNLVDRQGGGLFFNKSQNSALSLDLLNWKTNVNIPSEYKEFSISIYNSQADFDVIKLTLFINPKDLVIGQQQVITNAYTRRGWVNPAWGNQQATITASGVSSGFYFFNGSKGGLTNIHRKASPGFINLMDIMYLFKNNGWYFLNGTNNPNLFRDGKSRVINVMDSIKIEYDNSIYIGSFGTFTLNDVASNPYRLEYNFDFIVSSFGVDLQGIDGHIAINDNYRDDEVHVALQGFNIGFESIIGLDTEELNKYFPIEETVDPSLYNYSEVEDKDEATFYDKSSEKQAVKVPEGTFKVTRGWYDSETHNGKCDFRTSSGTVYSATEGTVVMVKTSPDYGGSNYVIVKSEYNGKSVYVRYFHLKYGSINLKKGDYVSIGTIVGSEGTDGGKYPAHCDFEVKEIKGTNTNYSDCERIEASPILNSMWQEMHAKASTDKVLAKDFSTLLFKHGQA